MHANAAPSAEPQPTPRRPRPGAARAALRSRPTAGAAAATAAAFVVFSLWADHFLTLQATSSYLTIAAELGIVALGVTLLMVAGEFDLSVGSVLGLSALLVPLLVQKGVPPTLAILLGLLAAAAVGASSALIVTYTQAPSLIVTLGAMMFWRGVIFALTGGFPVPVQQDTPVFKLFSAQWHGFNVSIVWLLGLVAVLSFVLLRTPFGNWIFATGGNPEAARKTGIPTRRVKVTLFVVSSLLAALAGMIQMTRFGSVDALRGQGIELPAVAAAVIGGTRLEGGAGTIMGTAFGVITFGMIQVGLQLATVPGYFYQALVGLVLVVAVLVHRHTPGVLKSWR